MQTYVLGVHDKVILYYVHQSTAHLSSAPSAFTSVFASFAATSLSAYVVLLSSASSAVKSNSNSNSNNMEFNNKYHSLKRSFVKFVHEARRRVYSDDMLVSDNVKNLLNVADGVGIRSIHSSARQL